MARKGLGSQRKTFDNQGFDFKGYDDIRKHPVFNHLMYGP